MNAAASDSVTAPSAKISVRHKSAHLRYNYTLHTQALWRRQEQQKREEVHAALQYAASFHCLVEEWKDCEEFETKARRKVDLHESEKGGTKHQTEWWCVAANKYRCVQFGKCITNMKEQGKRTGPKWLTERSKHKLTRWRKLHVGGLNMVRRVDRHGEALIWCRKISGYARQKWNFKTDLILEEARDGKLKGKQRVTREEYTRLRRGI